MILSSLKPFFFGLRSPLVKAMRKRCDKLFALRLAVLLCIHLTAAGLAAQEAYKIDEAKNPRCDLSEVPPIDPPPHGKFATALYGNPEARGAVVVYDSLEGQAKGYAEQIRERLINYSGVDAKRLRTLYGGPAEGMRMELWIIPKGAAEPRADFVEDTSRAREFDRYSYMGGDVCPPSRPLALKVFAEKLKQRPEWQGYIVVRPHRNRRGASAGDDDWDADGHVSRREALLRAAVDKRHLVRKFGLSGVRIKALVGDDDTWTHAELWLVPPGAYGPPTVRTKSPVKQR